VVFSISSRQVRSSLESTCNREKRKMRTVRSFSASVSFHHEGQAQEEEFPVQAFDYAEATRMAFTYVLKVMRLGDFELRVVGA
jgi:hypothetical protein